MIGFYSHQTRNIPRAAIWCSGFHICRKSISLRNFLYFFEKLFCISVQSYFWKQSRSVGNDNFIPHDSWSSAVIDRRSKSGNDQKFFPLSSSSQCSSSWSIFYHHLLLFGQLTNNMYVVSNSLTQWYTFLRGVVLVIFVVVFLLNNLRHDGVPVDGVLFWFVVGVSTAVHCR